jgi:hypothetical protein
MNWSEGREQHELPVAVRRCASSAPAGAGGRGLLVVHAPGCIIPCHTVGEILPTAQAPHVSAITTRTILASSQQLHFTLSCGVADSATPEWLRLVAW